MRSVVIDPTKGGLDGNNNQELMADTLSSNSNEVHVSEC